MSSVQKIAPMGWNSWDCWGAAVDEATVRANAEYMAKYLRPCGWEYIVVDIQWYEPNAGSHNYTPFAELWSAETAEFDGSIRVTLPRHGAKAFRLTEKKGE